MSDAGWYYADRGERRGPVEMSALRALVDAGVVGPTTNVWREGMNDWEPAYRHVSGMAPPAPGAPRSPSYPYASAGRDYFEQVGMGEALRRFFGGYVDFSGRANRGEYWWAYLALILVSVALLVVDFAVLGAANNGVAILSNLWSLAIFLPSLAIAVRRLHDIDSSGWWLLIGLIPLVGAILLLVWFATRGTDGPNRFG